MFNSPEETLSALRSVGYITNIKTATAVYLAANLDRPILQEGPAGAGKTELANSLCLATGMEFIRLQCYEGITDKEAIGHYNTALQQLYAAQCKEQEWSIVKEELLSRSFFISGPLLQAIESEKRALLLIDELDKVDHAFEALLLEILSVFQLSVPGIGTIKAKTVPFVVLTSNQERELGAPLRRRSLYLRVEHPTPKMEAEIVARKTPHCSQKTHRFIAGLAKILRAWSLEKPPSISEMNDIARAMELLGISQLGPEHQEIMMPLLAKTEKDYNKILMRDGFRSIVYSAAKYADQMEDDVSTEEKNEESDLSAALPPAIVGAMNQVELAAGVGA